MSTEGFSHSDNFDEILQQQQFYNITQSITYNKLTMREGGYVNGEIEKFCLEISIHISDFRSETIYWKKRQNANKCTITEKCVSCVVYEANCSPTKNTPEIGYICEDNVWIFSLSEHYNIWLLILL